MSNENSAATPAPTAPAATPAMKAVFGHNVVLDANGNPVEKGFGSVTTKTSKILELEKPAEDAAKTALEKLHARAAEELAAAKAKAQSEIAKIEAALKDTVHKIEDEF